MIKNLVSMSGGKDSTAMALLALEDHDKADINFAFSDTGHEHALTYEYLDYLRDKLQITIDVVSADFTDRIAKKRQFMLEKWLERGVQQDRIDRAVELMVPTGIPFLDLCMWKGRFPSTKARFCSIELKHNPLDEYAQELLAGAKALISWQGVRADESPARANLPEKDVEFGTWEPEPAGLLIYRPIIKWTVEQVFAQHKKHGIEPNPLYKMGMGRVGCMPCIHARKDELRQIAMRFPEEVERVKEWEAIVSETSRRGASSFFPTADNRGGNIGDAVEWSKTTRGGHSYDLIHAVEVMEHEEAPQCSSIYGLCE